MSEKILIIDGHSMLNRAFYGLPDLTNAQGRHTGAVLGFLNILFRVLEEEKPVGIKMVKVHPFSYAAFGNRELLESDLYAVRESDAEEMLPIFAPLEGEALDTGGRELFLRDGVCYGVKLSGPGEEGVAAAYMGYEPGESYYLFFNANSLHLSGGDGAALRVAEALLKLK